MGFLLHMGPVDPTAEVQQPPEGAQPPASKDPGIQERRPRGGSRQRRHQKKRRALGLCRVEGCKETSGRRYRCPAHAEAHKQLMRVRRHAG